MIGLDTNILVRYVIQDDPEQSRRATALIETYCTRAVRGHIALVVLCELVWVLRRAYRYDRALIADLLDRILATAELAVESEDAVANAVAAYRDGPADFSDYVILYINSGAGCDATYSFDQKLTTHSQARQP